MPDYQSQCRMNRNGGYITTFHSTSKSILKAKETTVLYSRDND